MCVPTRFLKLLYNYISFTTILLVYDNNKMVAARTKHIPSVLLTEDENAFVLQILGQKRYVSIGREN